MYREDGCVSVDTNKLGGANDNRIYLVNWRERNGKSYLLPSDQEQRESAGSQQIIHYEKNVTSHGKKDGLSLVPTLSHLHRRGLTESVPSRDTL